MRIASIHQEKSSEIGFVLTKVGKVDDSPTLLQSMHLLISLLELQMSKFCTLPVAAWCGRSVRSGPMPANAAGPLGRLPPPWRRPAFERAPCGSAVTPVARALSP